MARQMGVNSDTSVVIALVKECLPPSQAKGLGPSLLADENCEREGIVVTRETKELIIAGFEPVIRCFLHLSNEDYCRFRTCACVYSTVAFTAPAK